MARLLKPLVLFLLCTMITVFFCGCAAGPASKASLKAAPLTPAQKASNAVKSESYQQAVKLFDAIRDQGQEIPAENLYDYGLGLNQTGRHAEALQQLTKYVENVDRRLAIYQAALGEMNLAEQKLQVVQQEEERARIIKANLGNLTQTIDNNSQQVQQLLEARTTSFTEPLTGMGMLLITGGCYQMGDQFGDGKAEEQPVHQVCVGDFYLGKYEVTQAQWLQVMGYNPSRDQQGGHYPVDSISWKEALAFTTALSGNSGNYRLPTEAEWEYAARSGGQKQKFSGSNNVDEVAWHLDNAGQGSHPVGQKQANGFGLYDMSGNLYEWCFDRYAADYYRQSPVQNPTGASKGSERSQRGGSWSSKISYSRSSYRTSGDEETSRSRKTGLRLALPVTR